MNDHAAPPQCIAPPLWAKPPETAKASPDAPTSGSVPVGLGSAGQVAVARIPVPGSSGLFVELSPRGHVPKGGSTSTLFIQDTSGKRQLRLDYGYNKQTGKVDYHWNQKGTFDQFKIADHTSVGEAGETLYKSAKYLKYGGRVLLVVGVAADVISIVEAKKKLRQVLKVTAGWGGSWLGCEALGAGGAAVGTAIEPGGGTAVGGIAGCAIGGVGGYFGFSWAVGEAYDYVEEIYYQKLPEAAPPSQQAVQAP